MHAQSTTEPKRHELVLVDYLRNVTTDLPPFVHNKPLTKYDCTYCPDILYELTNSLDGTPWALITELDEDQHRGNKTDDERMLVIARALGTPVHFIRFNMDAYKDSDGEPNATAQERMAMLAERIREYVATAPSPPEHPHISGAHISVEYMFYDDTEEPRTTWSDITNLRALLGCPQCGLDFDTRGSYVRHCRATCIPMSITPGSLSCAHCATKFTTRKALQRHNRSPPSICVTLRQQTHVCPTCDTVCASVQEYVEHALEMCNPRADQLLTELDKCQLSNSSRRCRERWKCIRGSWHYYSTR